MRHTRSIHADADRLLEALAAELTAAAYTVALRHRAGETWLDLQLELWQVLTETVKKWRRESRARDESYSPHTPAELTNARAEQGTTPTWSTTTSPRWNATTRRWEAR